MALKNTLLIGVTALLASRVGAVDNGLAITPQMGCKKYSKSYFHLILTFHRG
jgi:hypothetical protein